MQRLFITLICLIPSLSFAKTADFKVIDQGGSGPFSAIAATETSLSDYVIYRPKQLSAGQNHYIHSTVLRFTLRCQITSYRLVFTLTKSLNTI